MLRYEEPNGSHFRPYHWHSAMVWAAFSANSSGSFGVAGNFPPDFPAQQTPAGNAEVLPQNVPERHIDGGDRAHQDRPAAPVGVTVRIVPDRLDVAGVFADQVALQIVDRLNDRRLFVLERRFAHAVQTVHVGHDLHKNPVRPVRVADESANFFNFHGLLLLNSISFEGEK